LSRAIDRASVNWIHTAPRPLTTVCWRVSFSGASKPVQIAGGADRLANMHVFASTALYFPLQNLSQ
jgi:hypothetical protein